jgi:DNA modification methylase
MEINKIYKGDCIEVMKQLPDESIDLIFADPPYNMQLGGDLFRPDSSKVDAVDDHWDQFDSFKHYDNFTTAWMTEANRILKPNGTIWVIGSYHNIFRVGKIMQDIGFWILNDVVWIKSNPMPNFLGTRFNNAHETLIWASKNEKSKFTFHYKSMKSTNDDKQMRSDWYIPICSGSERLRVDGQKVHSTQKPEALLHRIIISTSNPGDLILDPFMGSGTTGAVAKTLGRNYIGIEQEDRYIKAANERIDNKEVLPLHLLEYPIEIKPPKVPFGELIENGKIKIGEFLYSKDEKQKALILADSTLQSGEFLGSIHKVSAQILGKTANNGWDYWYVKDKTGSLKSIDRLRDEYLKEIAEFEL